MEENPKKNRGLGKGLSELLGEARAKAALSKQVKTEIPETNPKPPTPNKQPQFEASDDFSQELDALNNISGDTGDFVNSVSEDNQNDDGENESFEENFDNSYTDPNDDATESENYDDYSYDEDEDEDDDDVYETITENSKNPTPQKAPLSTQFSAHESIKASVQTPKQIPVQSPAVIEEDIAVIPETVIPKKVFVNDADPAPAIEHLPQKFFTPPSPQKDMIHELPIELVNPNKEQPRKFFDVNELNDLATSIKVYGIIQPILVKKIDTEYMIVAGERRWRASQIAGLKKIPAIIVPYQDNEILEIALIENIQRANLAPLDEAQAYHYLMNKYALTQFELSQRIGKSRSYIANILRLLELDDTVKNYLETGELSVGHAKVLVGVKNAADLAEKIVKSHMSVRKAEELISQLSEKQNVRLPKALNTGKNTDILALEADLRAALGVNVSINTQTAQKGSLVIRYESLEQLDEVCRRLCSNWGAEVA